MMIERIT